MSKRTTNSISQSIQPGKHSITRGSVSSLVVELIAWDTNASFPKLEPGYRTTTWTNPSPERKRYHHPFKTRKVKRTHFRSIPYSDVADALLKVDAGYARRPAQLGIRFMVLTATRNTEARQAVWSEIDLEDATWTIPGNRNKSGSEHRIPLSRQAIVVLREAKTLSDGSDYVFPGRDKSKSIDKNTFGNALRSAGVDAVPHGFRSSFRNWAEEQTSASWVAKEMSLGHQVGSEMVRSYMRTDLFEQRRELMQDWADYLDQ